MKANEIEEPLKRFFTKENPYKCILINGVWGIGKTYEVKKVIDDRKDILYTSLFGLKNLNDLYTALASYKITFKSVGKLFDIIRQLNLPYGVNALASLVTPKYIFYRFISQAKYENNYLVIDDLERISESFPIDEFMGFIETLKLENIKIVLIACVEKFKEDNVELFQKYKEKIIDRTYEIDLISENLLIADDFESKIFINDFIQLHEVKNIRTIEKAENLYKDIYDQIHSITEDDIKKNIREVCYSIVTEDIEKIYNEKKEESEQEKDTRLFEEILIGFRSRLYKYLFKVDNFSNSIIEPIIQYYYKHQSIEIDDIKKSYDDFKNNENRPLFNLSTEEIREYIKQQETEIRTEHFDINILIDKIHSIIEFRKILKLDIRKAIELFEKEAIKYIQIDIDLDLDLNLIREMSFYDNNLLMSLQKINKIIINEYFEKIFQNIEFLYNENKYKLINIRLNMIKNFAYEYQKEMKSLLKHILIDKALLIGNVNDDQILCWRRIVEIARQVDERCFKKFIEEKFEEYKDDKMFIYRTNHFYKQ